MPMTGNALENEGISLYFHIPFCTKKCDYCHFYVLPDKDALKIQFLKGIELEWQRVRPLLQGKKVATLYFGGGTPYLLGPQSMEMLIGWVMRDLTMSSNPIEVTLEANPENVDLATMQAYRSIGINRVSIGIQSLDPALLQRLGRTHTAARGIEAIYNTEKAGLSNISIDLMYDLPGQTLETWETTLKEIATKPISHLSLYNLTIEPHTRFFRNKATLLPMLPAEDASTAMYEMAKTMLEEAGLQQYEISAFARNGKVSIHNSGYWQGRNFLGLGPSAFSYWEGKRFRNSANLSKYCTLLQAGSSAIDFEETLTSEASKRELFVLNLRLIDGVDLNSFQEKFGPLESDVQHALRQLQKQNLVLLSKEHALMTKKGILFYDTIASELI